MWMDRSRRSPSRSESSAPARCRSASSARRWDRSPNRTYCLPRLRLMRDGASVWTGRIGSLRRFKDDVREVSSGFECGISLDGMNDVKVGDAIEAFTIEELARTLA